MMREDLMPDAAPLASSGGKQFQPKSRGDFSDLFELMEVIEALCPVWPRRPIRTGSDFRM